MKIIRAMQEGNPAIFTPKGVYDGRAIFYSTVIYPFGKDGQQEVCRSSREGLALRYPPDSIARLQFQVSIPERGDFKVRLKKVAEINPE